MRDERNLLYRYDSELGWFPRANSSGTHTGNVTFSVRSNSQGFRDVEHGPGTKPRIAFMGDSLTWGYDVEANERFTDLLQAHIPSWEILNFGVSGFGPDQEYLLLRRVMPVYRPDVVVFVYCTENDRTDDTTNMRYGGYYKPYFVHANGVLALSGVPVPRSINYFLYRHRVLSSSALVRFTVATLLQRMQPAEVHVADPTEEIYGRIASYVRSRGARLLVAVQQPDVALTDFLASVGVPTVDLNTPLRYPESGQHWTPEGHAFVEKRLFRALEENGLLSGIDGGRSADGSDRSGTAVRAADPAASRPRVSSRR